MSLCSALILVCIVLCVFASCPNSLRSGSATSQAPAVAALPQGWPIPQLTLPVGAKPGTMPSFFQHVRDDPSYPKNQPGNILVRQDPDGYELWVIGFTGDFSYSDLVAHAEPALLSAGYELGDSNTWNDSGGAGAYESYYNDKKRHWVRVSHDKQNKSFGIEPYETYFYFIQIDAPEN